jgi:hypothetical protein
MKFSVRAIIGGACALGMGAGLAAFAGLVPSLPSGQATQDNGSQRAAALQAFKAELANRAAPNMATHGFASLASNPVLQAGSFNWAGYADTSTTAGKFTSVSGSWVVPAITCTPEDRIMSIWVGLDGAGSSTVEQDGVSAQCFRNTAHYYTWYEMYPAGSVAVGISVRPGDHIAASVSRSGTAYTLKLVDSTTGGNSFTRLASCASTTCKDQSVEWIVERPALRTGIVPFAQFGKATLSAARATAGSTSGIITSFSPTDQITMTDSTRTYALDTTSPLNATHNGFSTTWLNSY